MNEGGKFEGKWIRGYISEKIGIHQSIHWVRNLNREKIKIINEGFITRKTKYLDE